MHLISPITSLSSNKSGGGSTSARSDAPAKTPHCSPASTSNQATSAEAKKGPIASDLALAGCHRISFYPWPSPLRRFNHPPQRPLGHRRQTPQTPSPQKQNPKAILVVKSPGFFCEKGFLAFSRQPFHSYGFENYPGPQASRSFQNEEMNFLFCRSRLAIDLSPLEPHVLNA